MTELATTAAILGAATILVSAPCLVIPSRARSWLQLFPRSKLAAWLLSAVALAWAGRLLMTTSLGRFENLKPGLYVLTPIVYLLVVNFMNELLAPRALGCLMILAPARFLLDVARWHGSSWRLVIVGLAYLLAGMGVILVLSPFEFRKAMAGWTTTDAHCRLLGALGALLGLFILILALKVY